MLCFNAKKALPHCSSTIFVIYRHIPTIHVIFSWAQIGRSAIFGREIGVPDREVFSRQKIFKFNVKNCLFASP